MGNPPSVNPYEPPQADLAPGPAAGHEGALAEKTRRDHLRHEASIQGLGSLWLLGGALSLLLAAYYLLLGVFHGGFDLPGTVMAAAVLLGFGGLGIVAGLDLRRLAPRGRTTGTIVSALGLLSIPVGTLIGAYALYLLHSRKGRLVMSAEYAEVRRQTPHVKYKTSIVVWILLVVLVGVIVAGIIGVVF